MSWLKFTPDFPSGHGKQGLGACKLKVQLILTPTAQLICLGKHIHWEEAVWMTNADLSAWSPLSGFCERITNLSLQTTERLWGLIGDGWDNFSTRQNVSGIYFHHMHYFVCEVLHSYTRSLQFEALETLLCNLIKINARQVALEKHLKSSTNGAIIVMP